MTGEHPSSIFFVDWGTSKILEEKDQETWLCQTQMDDKGRNFLKLNVYIVFNIQKSFDKNKPIFYIQDYIL